MNFNTERERYLCDKLGMPYVHHMAGMIYTVKGVMDPDQYFMRLWRWARVQKWFGFFVKDVVGEDDGFSGPLKWPINQDFIDPEEFAQALYYYLKPEAMGDAIPW